MDRFGKLRERRHVLQKGRRRTPVETLACVHGNRSSADRSVDQNTVGEACLGRGIGVGQSRDENGRASRTVPVHRLRDETALDEGLLRRQILEDGPQQRRLRDSRNFRRAPRRQVAQRRGPGHRVGFSILDRTVRFGQVQSRSSVQDRH